jgi:uncharacterized protein (TIGR00730 family)
MTQDPSDPPPSGPPPGVTVSAGTLSPPDPKGPTDESAPAGPAHTVAPPEPATTEGPRPGEPPAGADDRFFLEGPHSRLREVLLLGRVVRDFIKGFRVLHFVGPCVTIFGSARFGESHPHYALAREIGDRVARLGFTVMTGGGPGLMEAANRGAREAGGHSVGCNIELPLEQAPNAYLDRYVTCHYFFVRKVLLFKYSYAFVALPGGLGTLDELTEALTLIQTGKIHEYPVILIGTSYWQPFVALLREMLTHGAVGPSDLDLLIVTDDLDEAMRHLETHAVAGFGLRRVRRRAQWWLGEAEIQK